MRFPADALDAFLEGLLTELKSPADPETLGQIRAAFRRRIPFHMRSYAAAVLIMRAAGLSRGVSARAQQEGVPAPASAKVEEPRIRTQRKPVLTGDPSTRPAGKASQSAAGRPGASDFESGSPRFQGSQSPFAKKTPKETPARSRQAKPEQEKLRSPKPESPRAEAQETQTAQSSKPRQASYALSVPSTPLFVSMGRRQRLRAAEVRDLFMEKAGLGVDEVGQVRLFDNYCFIDIASEKAQAATEAVNGAELRGRSISVGPAKPRGEMPREASGTQELPSEEGDSQAGEAEVRSPEGGQEP